MLPGEGVGRGYRLHEGSQIGLCATRFNKKTLRVVPAHYDCLWRRCTSWAHWVFSRRRWYDTCMDNHHSCPDSSRVAYTRQDGERRNLKANTNRVSPLLGHQLRSAPFPVQATGASWNKAMNNACTYVPTGGVMAEEAPRQKSCQQGQRNPRDGVP